MAGNDITIVVNARDNASVTLGSIGRNARRLDSDTARLGANLGLLPPSLSRFAAVGVPAIGAVGQAAAAAGPVLLALAAAGGAVMLGMDGIKAAAATIAPQFEAMKKSVSDVFERQLTPVMQKLASDVFPTLTQGMEQMALSLSSVASDMVDFVATEAGLAKLKDTLGGAAMFINGMRPGLVAALDMLLTMGQAAAPAMAELGRAFGSIFENLNAKVQELVGNGAFQAAIEGFSATVRGLGEVVAEVFGAIVEAGAGLGDSLGQALSLVADVIKGLAPLLRTIAEGVGVALKALVAAAQPIVDALTPVVKLLAEQLSQAIKDITPQIMELATQIGEFLGQAITDLAPLIPQIVQGFIDLTEAILPLLPRIMELAEKVLPLLPPVVKAIVDGMKIAVPIIIEVVVAIVDLGIKVVETAISVGEGIGQIIGFFTNLDASVRGIITGLVVAVITKWTELKLQASTAVDQLVVAVITKFTELKAQASSAVQQLVATVVQKFTELKTRIIQACTQAIAGALQAFRSAISQFASIGGQIIDGIINGISSGAGRLANAARNVAINAYNAALSALGINSPSRLFRDGVGKGITEGMALGINQTAGNVAQAAVGASMGAFSAAQGAFGGLGNSVTWGSVDEGMWGQLKAAGWKGRAGDNAERLYRPAGGSMASGGGHGRTVTFAGNTSDALATVIMGMIRTGKIQIG